MNIRSNGVNSKTFKNILHYDPNTGVFTWINPTCPTLKIGDKAGNIYSSNGYCNIKIDKRPYLAHRLAFLYMIGYIPKLVDHINRNKLDNRWINLRPTTYGQNRQNSLLNKNNKSEVKGVHYRPNKNKVNPWYSTITFNKKTVHVGCFSSKKEAEKAHIKNISNYLENNVMENKELLTEVTSVVDQEQKTGQKIEVPKPEDLINKAMSSFIGSMVHFEKMFAKLSAKQKTRVTVAILDLPTEGAVVKLKTNEEKYCYVVGQRIQSDRFIIIQDSINKQIQEHKDKLAKEQEAKSEITMLTEEQSEQLKNECHCFDNRQEHCTCATGDLKCLELEQELKQEISNNIK